MIVQFEHGTLMIDGREYPIGSIGIDEATGQDETAVTLADAWGRVYEATIVFRDSIAPRLSELARRIRELLQQAEQKLEPLLRDPGRFDRSLSRPRWPSKAERLRCHVSDVRPLVWAPGGRSPRFGREASSL